MKFLMSIAIVLAFAGFASAQQTETERKIFSAIAALEAKVDALSLRVDDLANMQMAAQRAKDAADAELAPSSQQASAKAPSTSLSSWGGSSSSSMLTTSMMMGGYGMGMGAGSCANGSCGGSSGRGLFGRRR